MKIYKKHIFSVVQTRKEKLERQDKYMVFQKNNHGDHGIASKENPARHMKDVMNLDYVNN